ncbi:MAG: zinc-binding dehydrogenase, partial [Acidimicrobiaceae bacterium]|nr:zinc-binding dehydrogenase [Acidimicrobiaceae bacterium]
LWSFISERSELEARAAELFGWISLGELEVRIAARLPLAKAPEAHRLIQSRHAAGKILLIC